MQRLLRQVVERTDGWTESAASHCCSVSDQIGGFTPCKFSVAVVGQTYTCRLCCAVAFTGHILRLHTFHTVWSKFLSVFIASICVSRWSHASRTAHDRCIVLQRQYHGRLDRSVLETIDLTEYVVSCRCCALCSLPISHWAYARLHIKEIWIIIIIYIHRVSHKKRATLFLIITPAFLGRFLYFLYQ